MKKPAKRLRSKSAKSSPRPKISYIVSAYIRPKQLTACLATLAIQNESSEVIVCLNSTADYLIKEHRAICTHFGARLLLTGKMGATCCYSSAEIAAGQARGEWLCFPSDDSLYVPDFADLMMRAARQRNLDLVYCDALFDPMSLIAGDGRYGILHVEPKVRGIDKTMFMVKRKWFDGFPGKRLQGGCSADGAFIEDLVRHKIRHGRAEGILVVHT